MNSVLQHDDFPVHNDDPFWMSCMLKVINPFKAINPLKAVYPLKVVITAIVN